MAEVMAGPANPSSVHAAGRRALSRLRHARDITAMAMGAAPEDVVFTSGGTEANRLALAQADGPVAVSAVEHASVLEAGPAALIPVDADGVVDFDRLDDLLCSLRPALVSVMAANNETGVIQPVVEIARRCRAIGALLHVDAVQALGKMPTDMLALGADLVTVSAHKIGGPPGVGALAHRPGLALRPLQRGGGQEMGRRAGTENLPGIVGFASALSSIEAAEAGRVAVLRDRLEAGVPFATVVGQGAARLANTSCLILGGVRAEVQLMRLDLDGIMVSAGAACSSGKVAASHVLTAMGLDEVAARSAIRVSLGWASTAQDVDRFIESYSRLAGLATRAASPT